MRVERARLVAGRSNIEPTRSRVDAREANVADAPARAETRAMIVAIVGIVDDARAGALAPSRASDL